LEGVEEREDSGIVARQSVLEPEADRIPRQVILAV